MQSLPTLSAFSIQQGIIPQLIAGLSIPVSKNPLSSKQNLTLKQVTEDSLYV
ncbi:unnamed protein product [Periconia digitata]|uniref:Uncharacterized protein n=1 Tax=Periconia digitata TaxID=1303443 RepID=A0A9W4XK90_9PLEO|nr:unnamed protein product [Periconia digitata]